MFESILRYFISAFAYSHISIEKRDKVGEQDAINEDQNPLLINIDDKKNIQDLTFVILIYIPIPYTYVLIA